MSYTLKITTESFLLTGSGEGAALIDADVVFHPSGFPMIPARRVKGMLKESLVEVLEIFGKKQGEIKAMVSSLFGDPGLPTYQGKLLFHNLMLEGWDQIAEEIKNAPPKGVLQPDFVKAYFTEEVQQTAIGREGKPNEVEGVAKKRSLRNYRVIKPGYTFESPLSLTDVLNEKEEKYLKHASLNLRHAGTRRNRGFGKIRCQLEPLKSDSKVQTRQVSSSEESSSKIKISINTLSPVVLAELQGEQNTVFTRKYISGNQLRGLLANEYIRSQGLAFQNAHLDPGFQELFLYGKLKFGDLRFKQGEAVALHLHQYKRYPDKEPISVFAKSENDEEITKSIKGIGQVHGKTIQKEGFIPKTTFNFHNSRPNRAAGRNMESDAEGGIFYYESLNEGQIFDGSITGESVALSKLLASFPTSFKARLGRSRSAQYGRVEVSLVPENKTDKVQSLSVGEYILILESPLILLNKWGAPSPTVKELEDALFEAWGFTVKIKNAAAAFTKVEQFNAVWLSKSGQVSAFKEGSSFLIEASTKIDHLITTLGEWTEQGFGKVKVVPFNQNESYSLNDSPASQDDLPEAELNFSNKILRDLQEAFSAEQKELGIKQKAIQAAERRGARRLNNHLIGRMERLFERSQSAQEIEEWIKETKDKPAGDGLKKAGLVDYNHRFSLNPQSEIGDNWNLQKRYWITFFQTLRKLNKKDGKKG
jgi:CRISPR-associated protein Csx10